MKNGGLGSGLGAMHDAPAFGFRRESEFQKISMTLISWTRGYHHCLQGQVRLQGLLLIRNGKNSGRVTLQKPRRQSWTRSEHRLQALASNLRSPGKVKLQGAHPQGFCLPGKVKFYSAWPPRGIIRRYDALGFLANQGRWNFRVRDHPEKSFASIIL